MAVTTYLPVAKVHRRDDARLRNEEAVQLIANSMREVGQITPILVRPVGEEFEVIAGSHRLAAVTLLGWAEILAIHADHDDDLHAELAMIDENLCRSELSPADSARQISRRKSLYEELHPETRHGAAGRGRPKSCHPGNSNADRFVTNTAEATSLGERTVSRHAERGKRISDDALSAIRGTRLDKGVYLDALARVPTDNQLGKVQADLATPPVAGERAPYAHIGGPRNGHHTPAPVEAATTPLAHERLISALDMLDGITADDVIAQCPPRQRASLSQRASSAIDMLGDVTAGVGR